MIRFKEIFGNTPAYAAGDQYCADPDAKAIGMLVNDPEAGGLVLTHNPSLLRQGACFELMRPNRTPLIDLSRPGMGNIGAKLKVRTFGLAGPVLDLRVKLSASGVDTLRVGRDANGFGVWFTLPTYVSPGNGVVVPVPLDEKIHEIAVALRHQKVLLSVDNSAPVTLSFAVAKPAPKGVQTAQAWLMSSPEFKVHWLEADIRLNNLPTED